VTLTVLAYLPSPDQGVWHLGPFPIRAYALCILAGIVAALILGDRRWSARGGEPGVIYDIALWAVPFGLIGGRLYHVLTDWSTYFGDGGKGFGAALRIWDGGLGIWGAVALGGVGAWIGCRRRGIPLPAFGDAIAPGIILAQAIGRLGNYFNQELYGRPTTLPWGLEVYERRNAAGYPDSLNGVSTGQLVDVVHPTFLYELLWNLLVFGLLLLIDKRFRIGHGRLFALYVAGYCVGRFWIELMRSDYATTIGDTGIRVNTFTSTFVFIAAVVYVMVATKGREEPWTLRGKDAVAGGESVVDDAAENVTAAAATSGLVAAAVVAGKEDEPAASGAGDDAVDEFDGKKSEAAAEAEDLVEQVETASSEDIAEAEAFAEAGEEADDAKPEAGLGSVDGDEVIAAEGDAAEVQEAAAEGAFDAETLAADLGAEADAVASTDDPADDAESLVEDVPAEADSAAPEEGLGSVDGDEVTAAKGDAAEVHAAAVTGADDAEALADGVRNESETGEVSDATPTDAAPQEGLGSVDGDEVTAAEGDADEVHAAAVVGAGEAESLVDDVAAEAESEPEPEPAASSDDDDLESSAAPEEGLGSVDGDEVTAAEGDADEVHAAAVVGADEAESLADDVAAEAEAASEPEPEPAASSNDDDPEAGLGSVDGDEVTAAGDDAEEAHDAAVAGEADAKALSGDTTTPAASAPPTTGRTRRRWWQRNRG
jgi:prolipoprotein diacylglyceryl transferase